MQEPEVSLRIAMKYIEDGLAHHDVTVSIDGAHIRTKDTVHFNLVDFMNKNGYLKYEKDSHRWQGAYCSSPSSPKIIVSSLPGTGDVIIKLKDGNTLFIESKKIKKGTGGEYPAMREAIGQLMTNCPDRPDFIPVVAVPYSVKSNELAKKWASYNRIRSAGIHFMLIHTNGSIEFI